MKKIVCFVFATIAVVAALVSCATASFNDENAYTSTNFTITVLSNTEIANDIIVLTSVPTVPEVTYDVINNETIYPVDKHEHCFAVRIENEVKPDCELQGGFDRVVYCILCQEIMSIEHENLAPTGHVEIVDAAIPATCTESGKTIGSHCENCNVTLAEQKTINPTGHSVIIVDAIMPTCTENGLTEGAYCSACNAIIVEQKEIDSVGHCIVINEAIAATCTTNGQTEGQYCSVCKTVIVNTTTVNALGHTNASPVKENVHMNGSYDAVIYCNVCNVEISRTFVKPNVFIDPSNNNYYHIDESIYTDIELEMIHWILEQLPIVENSDEFIMPTLTLSRNVPSSDAYMCYLKVSSIFYIIYGDQSACNNVMDWVNSYDRNGNLTQSIRLKYDALKKLAAIRDDNLQKVDDVLRTIPVGSEQEILYNISEYIRNLIVYTKGYYDVVDALNGTSVCNGYALLFNMMANRAGIVTDMCIGQAGGWHAWNRVTLSNGSIRFYDITFYDGNTARPKYINSNNSWDRHYIINDYSECWTGQ